MESVQGEGAEEVEDEKMKLKLLNMSSRDLLAGLLSADQDMHRSITLMVKLLNRLNIKAHRATLYRMARQYKQTRTALAPSQVKNHDLHLKDEEIMRVIGWVVSQVRQGHRVFYLDVHEKSRNGMTLIFR